MDKMTIAAQLYTLREFTKTPVELEKTLKKVKSMGYNAIQVSGIGTIEPHALKQLADESGLKICVTHIPYDHYTNDLAAVIKDHKIWNCQYVGLGSMPPKYRNSRDGYDKFIKEFNEISKKIFDQGLKFVYHNHKFEFQKFDGITGMELLLSQTDPVTFGFEVDTYWVQAGGANPVDWIRKVAGRMAVVHFKDMAIKNNEQIFAEIGEGNLDWAAIIKACRETGVKWYAVEQDVCQRDPFESLKISLDYLHKFI